MPNFPALGKLFITFLRSPLCLSISVKGVVIEDGKVWLRLNERGQWELPGGRMEPREQPAQTMVREIREELGFEVQPQGLAHVYLTKGNWNRALILVYATKLISKPGSFEVRGEFGPATFQAFELGNLPETKFPHFYREAIRNTMTNFPA